ncbi:amidohydrolase family protein (plasmid) [Pseudarthrobacter psychrotolerans]|uniref:Amidohydrolase family protein n=1 Tax=Pseudarthrobacter psychrotolerans TaxID=2697569 RepID=A0A6P1NUB1_9MICC|nr:amidohydrolase family protein [Pseudarthrobacter psychrotolerans]
MAPTLYMNARVFTADQPAWAEALIVEGDKIAYVGDGATARRLAGDDCVEEDLDGALVLPGFVDGHAHIVATGEAAGQADLWGAQDLAEIQRRLSRWASAHPEAPRVRAQGWLHGTVPGDGPTRHMLDEVIADRPVYVQAYDYHSIWLNTAALAEIGINSHTVAPRGGSIARGESGEPTGYIDETAMQQLVWPALDGAASDAERDRHLEAALAGYRAVGVTAAIDMGLDEGDLAAMVRAEEAGTLTARIAAHWRIHRSEDPAENLAQVARAAELAARHDSPWLRVVGIKVLVDGTVDGCTATLGRAYADGSLPGPIWDLPALAPVVAAADAAGLQVAMHAIGDEAVRIAIAAVEHAVRTNGPAQRRHRIEHLEVVEQADIVRLAALGIVASMQPVHADPAIQGNWRAMLGDERIDRGFPWPEITDAGAALAFGTDSPTSPFAPLPNMFVAATRRSAFDPSLPPNIARYALPLEEAVVHATRDAAWSCRAEDRFGRLSAGLFADFIVLDRDVFRTQAEELLEAKVVRTVVAGRDVLAMEGAVHR